MNILYGVVGEGMGHATRSRVVVEHLIAQGHSVVLIASQRAVDFLEQHFEDVRRIHGMHIITEENRVRGRKTLFSNVEAGLKALPGQIRAYFDLIGDFRPDCVVSDFESWTYLFAKARGLPVLSVDNIQIVHRCTHPDEIRNEDRKGFEAAKAFVKGKLPGCDHYLITTFFRPPVRKPNTTLHPPILRPVILEAKPTSGGHLLVYQTAEGNEGLAEALGRSGLECRIYGMRRGISEEQREGRLRYRPFSETGFIDDLANARAVVSGGGFTLLSEAVYLHKPVLSVPIRGQFEQTLNAMYIERERYGRYASELATEVLGEFLERLPEYERALAGYHQDGNRDLLGALDHQLDRIAAGLV